MAEDSKILVVEDEPDIRGLITFSLKYAGFAVIEALNGEEALDMAAAEEPDLILLDVRMPKLNGYEVCKILKSQEDTKGIPIVFISARGQEAEIKRGLELGAEEYILKPFAPDELYRRVQVILQRGRSKKH
ncbi:MAG: response regulator transcription factor [Anaerolineae bacterium]|jgi:DNA-binding response OmpR family regulator